MSSETEDIRELISRLRTQFNIKESKPREPVPGELDLKHRVEKYVKAKKLKQDTFLESKKSLKFRDEAAELGLAMIIVEDDEIDFREMDLLEQQQADKDKAKRRERLETRKEQQEQRDSDKSQLLQLRGTRMTEVERKWLLVYLKKQCDELKSDLKGEPRLRSISRSILHDLVPRITRYEHGNFESPSDFSFQKSVLKEMTPEERRKCFEQDGYSKIYNNSFDTFLKDYGF